MRILIIKTIILLAVFFVLCVLAILYFLRAFIGLATPLDDISQIQEKTKYWFPTNAVVLAGEYRDGMGAHLVAKIEIPKDEVDNFLEKNEFKETSTTSRNLTDTSFEADWWNPDSQKSFISTGGTYSYPDYPYYGFLLIGLDADNHALIYLHWMP